MSSSESDQRHRELPGADADPHPAPGVGEGELGLSEPQLRALTVARARAIVVKVGTRALTTPEGRLDTRRVDLLAAQLSRIADTGRQTIMVSSGAVGAGVAKLGLSQRPKELATLQAVAAIGQTDLIRAYEQGLSRHNRHAAQVLLTKGDLRRRSGYLHVRNALLGIHELGAVAILNENDSVAVAELRTTFGDNDRLAAYVSGLVSDAMLVILSDIEGLYDRPPSEPGSVRIGLVRRLDDQVFALAKDRLNAVSKGGMLSKLKAAKIAGSYGHATIIGPGKQDDVLDRILAGDEVGTLFLPETRTIRGRKRWIGGTARIEGRLHVDAGAAGALRRDGKSLLAIGITRVQGSFTRGSVVAIVDPDGREVARGLCNYRSTEVTAIRGQRSERIGEILGNRPYECVVHRDNLVLAVVVD